MNNRKLKKWINACSKWILVVDLMLLIINIIIISWYLPSCPTMEYYFDYYGVIVGILSLLITLLIGWNIHSVIDIKSHVEKIKKYSTKVEKLNSDFLNLKNKYYKDMSETESAFVEMALSLYQNREPENRLQVIVFHGLRAAVWSAEVGEFDNAINILYALYYILKDKDDFKVQESLLKDMTRNIEKLGQYEYIANTDVYKFFKEMINSRSGNKGQQ